MRLSATTCSANSFDCTICAAQLTRFFNSGTALGRGVYRAAYAARLLNFQRRRQHVFRIMVAPSLKDLEFDAEAVARWYPLGLNRRSLVIDPRRAFGKPVAAESGIPAEVPADAVVVEGSVEKAARADEVPVRVVRDVVAFQGKLAA